MGEAHKMEVVQMHSHCMTKAPTKYTVAILTLGYSLGSMVHVGVGQGQQQTRGRCTMGKLNNVTAV